MKDKSEILKNNTIVASDKEPLPARVRSILLRVARQRAPITYQDLVNQLQLVPPNTIRQLALALEYLMEEDAAAGWPLIAALVISKSGSGLPAAGFFDCAQRLALYSGSDNGADACAFHALAFDAAVTYWGDTTQ